MNKISTALSYLFHPLLAPTIGLFIIFNTGTYMSMLVPEAKLLLYSLVFITTFLFPVISILFFLWQKVISNINIEDKQERILPFISTLIFYFVGYYILGSNNISGLLRAFYLGGIIALSLNFAINLFWKISAHLIGLGGLAGLVLAISFRLNVDLQYLFILIVIISGFVASARIQLKSHNVMQVIAGFYVGLLSVFITIMVY